MKIERRMAVTELEVRETSSHLILTGYASTFNQPYSMGWYEEDVDPGAFKRTLGRNPDVRLLINHDGLPLARTTSGTLTLDTDSRGLRPYAELDLEDPDVQRIAPKMRRGDLNQMSFAFRTISDEWRDDSTKRTLRELDLNNGDVSVVTYPANPNATAALRAAGDSGLEPVKAALAALEARNAPVEEVASVLARALGYFTAIDTIVDNAQDELSEVLGIPNPDDDEATETSAAEGNERARALAAYEARLRALRAL